MPFWNEYVNLPFSISVLQDSQIPSLSQTNNSSSSTMSKMEDQLRDDDDQG